MSSSAESGPPRLTPAMSSRRLQVLDFIRDYIAGHNASPSLGEIASGCGINRPRAHQLVKALIRQGLLVRRAGMRGLMLPSAIEEAKRQLRDAGFRVDEDFGAPELGAGAYTKTILLSLPPLDYLADRQQGGGNGGSAAGPERRSRKRRKARAA